MRKEIFSLLKSRPMTAQEVTEKVKRPSNHVWATLEIMEIEGLLKKKLVGADLEAVYGWPKKVEGKL